MQVLKNKKGVQIFFSEHLDKYQVFSISNSNIQKSFNCQVHHPIIFLLPDPQHKPYKNAQLIFSTSFKYLLNAQISILNSLIPAWIIGQFMGFMQNRFLLELMSKLDMQFGAIFDFFSNIQSEIVLPIEMSKDKELY